MRQLFEMMEEVSCPLKNCKTHKAPTDDEITAKQINLKSLEIFANVLSLTPEDLVVVYYYAKYLTEEVYILPNLFNNHQDETILRTKANIGATLF